MNAILVEPLEKTHYKLFSDFRVTEEKSDYFKTYLTLHALPDQEKGKARTYLCIERNSSGNDALLGFYSLRASSLIVEMDLGDKRKGEPAIELYELAVNKATQRRGIGKKLMQDAIATIYKASQIVGVRYILVCAKKDAVSYYKKFGFAQLPGYKDIPRSDDNSECIPMYISLHNK